MTDKSAKQDSLANVRDLRSAALRAARAADQHPRHRSLLVEARDAHREAERAGSSHYVRYGGGRMFESQNEDHRLAAREYDKRLADIDAEERKVAEARARTPEARAAALAYQAERAEDQAIGYHPGSYSGWSDARLRESRAARFAEAARLFDAAEEVLPGAGYARRAALVREKVGHYAGSIRPPARGSYQALSREVAADALERLASDTRDQSLIGTAQRTLLEVSSAYGFDAPESDRASQQRSELGRPGGVQSQTIFGWAAQWRPAPERPAPAEDLGEYYGRSQNDGSRIYVGEAAENLSHWWSGQDDPIYKIATLFSRRERPENSDLARGLRNLENYRGGEHLSDEESMELEDLISVLRAVLEEQGG